jgi:hypothetical protein
VRHRSIFLTELSVDQKIYAHEAIRKTVIDKCRKSRDGKSRKLDKVEAWRKIDFTCRQRRSLWSGEPNWACWKCCATALRRMRTLSLGDGRRTLTTARDGIRRNQTLCELKCLAYGKPANVIFSEGMPETSRLVKKPPRSLLRSSAEDKVALALIANDCRRLLNRGRLSGHSAFAWGQPWNVVASREGLKEKYTDCGQTRKGGA